MKYTIKCAMLLALPFSGCAKYPEDVEQALKLAGDNRKELEAVITHYNQNLSDSLKLKAAYFLIGNMDDYVYFEGEQIDNYYTFFELAKKTHITKLDSLAESLKSKYGVFPYQTVNMYFDINKLRADFLISNIDMAFKVWYEQPWGKKINFEQFCEYILPYKILNEKPDFNRSDIYIQYNEFLDSVRNTNGDVVAACSKINNELIRHGWTWTGAIDFLPHFGAKTLLEARTGNCREYADIAVYVMRATGIPVSIDFTPQWPFRSLGHEWNVLLNEQGINIPFMGVESNPGIPHNADHKKAKVYRRTLAKQKQSLAMLKDKNDLVPSLFNNSHFKDVSDEYFQSSDVSVVLEREIAQANKFAFLCVFNNKDWVPIHWGAINKKTRSVTFSKMGRDIVYLPVKYTGMLTAVAYPFLLTKEGIVKFLKPNIQKTQSMKILRKYPVLISFRLKRMVGARFQGANRSDFKDAVDLYKIDSLPRMDYQQVAVSKNRAFRYFRYYSAHKGYANIAELEFYSEDPLNPLKGEIIGTNETYKPDRTKEKTMDGDISTFFDAAATNPDSAWVGIDLGAGVKKIVKRIRYCPANDGNNICIGNDYELFYWSMNGWISVERKIAKTGELIFTKVPSGGLYLLHNHSGGQEERIFTYEIGKQVWW